MENTPVASTPSFFQRHQFLILRLHSLSGLLPVGAYMVVHLLTNASVLGGAATFQEQVDKIHALGPALPFIEWTFIFLPIIFHAAVGVVIIRSGISNAANYPLVGNVRYTLQRATAWIALFFIFYHVFQMHGWFHNSWWRESVSEPLGGGRFVAEAATSSAAMALKSALVWIIYLVGVLSCVFHLANGLWTMGITWGIWTTPAAQRRANYVCGAFGVLLAAVALGALVGMSSADVSTALATERVSLEHKLADLEAIKRDGGKDLDDQIEELKHSIKRIQSQQEELKSAGKSSQHAALSQGE